MAGISTTDITGNGVTTTLTGSPGTITGPFGEPVWAPTNGDYTKTPSLDLDGVGRIWISTWVQTPAPPTTGYIAGYSGSSWRLSLNSVGSIKLGTGASVSNISVTAYSAVDTTPPGRWSHVLAIMDTISGEAMIAVNGVDVTPGGATFLGGIIIDDQGGTCVGKIGGHKLSLTTAYTVVSTTTAPTLSQAATLAAHTNRHEHLAYLQSLNPAWGVTLGPEPQPVDMFDRAGDSGEATVTGSGYHRLDDASGNENPVEASGVPSPAAGPFNVPITSGDADSHQEASIDLRSASTVEISCYVRDNGVTGDQVVFDCSGSAAKRCYSYYYGNKVTVWPDISGDYSTAYAFTTTDDDELHHLVIQMGDTWCKVFEDGIECVQTTDGSSIAFEFDDEYTVRARGVDIGYWTIKADDLSTNAEIAALVEIDNHADYVAAVLAKSPDVYIPFTYAPGLRTVPAPIGTGLAVSLNGTDQSIDTGYIRPTGKNAVTVEGWAYITQSGAGAHQLIVSNANSLPSGQNGFRVSNYSADGNSTLIRFYVNDSYSGSPYTVGLTVDRWLHIAATVSLSDGRAWLYLDGAESSTRIWTPSGGYDLSDGFSTFLGSNGSGALWARSDFYGWAEYEAELSAADIAALAADTDPAVHAQRQRRLGAVWQMPLTDADYTEDRYRDTYLFGGYLGHPTISGGWQ